MPRFSRMQVLNAALEGGLVPLFHHPDPETMRAAVRAVHTAGIRLFEVTNRGDGVPELFAGLAAYCDRELPEMILGAGTVVEAGTAAQFMNAGANFIVSPVLNAEVARACNRRKIPHIPGVATLTETAQAEELGCEVVKLFPAGEIGGPDYLKAIRGPCPWSSVMPSGGVELTESSLAAWFGAGAACVAVGGTLFTKDAVDRKDFAGITSRLAAAAAIVKKVRSRT